MLARRPLPPSWFLVAVAGVALVVRLALDADVEAAPPVALAFFGFIIGIIGAIWTGVQAAGQVTLAVLQWSVLALWNFAKAVHNGALTLGKLVGVGFKSSWEFLKVVYDDVLKPAWGKFWQLVDRVRDTLERVFRPVFDVLRRIRDEFLKVYDRFVRPVLDSIGIARKVLRVFSALGFDWARRLDAKLGALEEKIDAPFRAVLRHINGIINLVNRVVTADGLFQRLALVRSLERDVRFLSRAFMNWRSVDLGDEAYTALTSKARERDVARISRDVEEALESGGGYYAPVVTEMSAQWRLYLEGRG